MGVYKRKRDYSSMIKSLNKLRFKLRKANSSARVYEDDKLEAFDFTEQDHAKMIESLHDD